MWKRFLSRFNPPKQRSNAGSNSHGMSNDARARHTQEDHRRYRSRSPPSTRAAVGGLEAEQQRVRHLQRELELSREHHSECERKRDQLERDCAQQQQRIATLEAVEVERSVQLDQQFEQNTELSDKVAILEDHVNQLNSRINRHVGEIEEFTNTAVEHKQTITELTGTILRLANSAGSTTTRDDDYFQGEISVLAGAIHQWVFRYFRGVAIQSRDLSLTFRGSLEAAILGFSPAVDRKISLKEIEAAVIDRFHEHIFRPDFVFRILDSVYRPVSDVLGGTALAKRTWHAQTANLILLNENFDGHLRNAVVAVFSDLENCFLRFAKQGTENQCRKALQSLIEHAARVELEICKQVSYIELPKIKPGAEYCSATMEDESGNVDDGEEEEGFIVQVAHFPPVLRWELDAEGSLAEKPVVVRKGTVFAAAE